MDMNSLNSLLSPFNYLFSAFGQVVLVQLQEKEKRGQTHAA